jgi:1-pyrroline-4-hydroxy-2-carboxylate deaminase
MPVVTACFGRNYELDYGFMAQHCAWLLDHGCAGGVLLGPLGEASTLQYKEKLEVLRICLAAVLRRSHP